jgi:hypothetical protein
MSPRGRCGKPARTLGKLAVDADAACCDASGMTPVEPAIAIVLALAVIYGMVVLGFNKRRLVWRTKCRVCGGPGGLCGCRRPRF